jgi:hypothetical protein
LAKQSGAKKLVKLCGPQHVELWQSIHIRDIMMARSEQTEGPNEGRRVTIARAQSGIVTTKVGIYRREGYSTKGRHRFGDVKQRE